MSAVRSAAIGLVRRLGRGRFRRPRAGVGRPFADLEFQGHGFVAGGLALDDPLAAHNNGRIAHGDRFAAGGDLEQLDSDGILFFDIAGFDGLLDAVGLLARANRNQRIVGARRHENDRHDRGRIGVPGRFVRETLAESLPHGRDDLTGVRVFQMVDRCVVFARCRRVCRIGVSEVDAVGGAIVRSIAGVSESSAKRPHGKAKIAANKATVRIEDPLWKQVLMSHSRREPDRTMRH